MSRSVDGDTCNTASWPMDKVRFHKQRTITGVAKGGCGVMLARTQCDYEMDKRVTEEAQIMTTLESSATVIYCKDMLDK